jgi:hypothetical protein
VIPRATSSTANTIRVELGGNGHERHATGSTSSYGGEHLLLGRAGHEMHTVIGDHETVLSLTAEQLAARPLACESSPGQYGTAHAFLAVLAVMCFGMAPVA